AVHHDQAEADEEHAGDRELRGAEAVQHAAPSGSARASAAKRWPRSSKLLNWSKLAQAGASRTTSPGSASAAARATASGRSAARSSGTAPASARSSSPADSPYRIAARTRARRATSASSSKERPLLRPPASQTTGAVCASRLAAAAAGLVAFESST